MADSTIRIAIKSDGSGAKVIKRDLDDISKKSKTTQTAMMGLTRVLGLLGGAVVATDILRMADQMTLLTARIKSATRSSEEFSVAFRGLAASSRATGTDLSAAVDVFQRLSFSRDEIGATVDEMVNFTATVQKLGVVSGASTQALQAGLTQLGQGLSAGILRAEEFNSILENIPAVGKQIADEFGVTVGQLRNLVLEGEVLSEDVFAAILNSQQKVNDEFEKMPLTVGRAFGQLRQDLAISIAGLNDVTDATGALAITISKLGDVALGIGNIFKSVFGAIKLIMSSLSALVLGLIEGILKSINFVIEQLNRIPSIDIGKLDSAQTFEDLRIGALKSGTQSGNEILSGISGAVGNIDDLFTGREERDSSQSVIKELSKDYADLAKGLSNASDKTKKLKDANKDMLQSIKEVQRAERERANEIGDTLFELGRGYTSLRDVALKALDDILRSMFRLSQGGTATSGIFGDIGGAIFGGLFGGGFDPSVSAPPSKPSIGFATGGSFRVGGTGGTDSQRVSFMATPGEIVDVKKPGQGSMSEKGNQIVYNIDARGADAGVEQRVMNALRKVEQGVPKTAVAAVQNANSRNLGFLS